MPTCTQCLRKRSLDDFSDAQLCGGRGKCLECSNPRLWARRRAADLGDRPLQDLGRSRKPPAADGSRQCTNCQQFLPLSRFSARQLAGKGKCQGCAAQASATNQAQQAEQARKRRHEGDEERIDTASRKRAEVDADEEEYVRGLLRGVEAARDAARRREPATAAAAAPVPLGEDSAGFALLQRLGWVPGTGLGAQASGGLLPVSQLLRSQSERDKRGLGQIDGADGAALPAEAARAE